MSEIYASMKFLSAASERMFKDIHKAFLIHLIMFIFHRVDEIYLPDWEHSPKTNIPYSALTPCTCYSAFIV